MENLFGISTATGAKPEKIRNIAGRSLLEAAGCTSGMVNVLAHKPDGRPCLPAQLSALPKNAQPAAIAQLMNYLASPQPIGGHEVILAANRTAMAERVVRSVIDRLTDTGDALPYAQLLQEVREAAHEEKTAVEAELPPLRDRFSKADALLRKYQDEAAQATGGSASLFDAFKRLLGSYVKLTEAVKAFNDRENVFLHIATHEAAVFVFAQVMSSCDRLLGGLEATRAAAGAGEAAALDQAQQVARRLAAQGRSADHVVSYERIVEALCEPGSETPYLAELIAHAREQGRDGVVEKAREIAERIAHQQLGGLGLVDLIRMEAAHSTVNGKAISPDAAPLLVGMHLLELVRRVRPSARLTDDAKANDYIVQVSPDETPLFYNPNLVAAQFRKPVDEFAFMRIQTDLAVHELRVIREGEKDFQAALDKREFFVLEDMAQQYAKARKAGVAAVAEVDRQDVNAEPVIEPAATHSPNGSGH